MIENSIPPSATVQRPCPAPLRRFRGFDEKGLPKWSAPSLYLRCVCLAIDGSDLCRFHEAERREAERRVLAALMPATASPTVARVAEPSAP